MYLKREKLILAFTLILFLCLPIPSHAQRVLKAGIDSSLPPFSFIDHGSNTVRGFNVDLVKLLSANLGAKIRFIPMEGHELGKALSEGRVDLVVDNKSVGTDLPYLELPLPVEKKLFVNNCCVTVTCVKDLAGHMIVFQKGNDPASLIPEKKDVQFMEAKSQEDVLQILDSGQATAFISPNSRSTIYLIQKNQFKNIKEVGMPVETVPLAVFVGHDNTPLLTELSVAFGKITENKEYETIYRKWFGHDIPFSDVTRYLKIVGAAAGLFAIALSAVFFWNRALKRRVRQVTGDLQLSEQKHKDLIEFSPEMIHLIAPDGMIMHANQLVLQQLGYDRGEISFLRLSDLVAPEARQDVDDFIETVFRKGKTIREFSFYAKDGRRMDVEVSAVIIKGPEGDLACCFSRDMTDRKRLEEELIQSERLAIMGEMAAGIAHEINNPLGIILANAEELLQHKFEDEETKEGLRAVERNALRAGKFIDDLLTFTRPTPPTKNRIDLVALVEESLMLCKQQLRKKHIVVEREFPEDSLLFEGDDSQIQQVMVNLILNAVQAIPEKGFIRIRAGRMKENGSEAIHLEINDSGMGIPEKDLTRIFDPFYTARKNKGFGLGLSISKRIIEKHNGSVRIESAVGKGTAVLIDLPANPPSVETAGTSKTARA
jgi:PAS domain S-box-containing protein